MTMKTTITAYEHFETANNDTVRIKIDEFQGSEPPPVFFRKLAELKKEGHHITCEKTVTSVVQIATI